ncbi:PH domain-containing protein [uncultured Oscillibacter sp.]|uniref:PH domain-containing protein n=1 Tax=uncultured Oscillibacter sp. TaxID=876091 RepID=UPI0025D4B364|nr:PH domain-containing protein [uncultured Oscillibacter sp.]
MEQEIHLKKAEDMYAYSCTHGFGKGLTRAWGINSFRLVEQAMDEDEFAFLTFIGLHRFHSMSAHQRNFAYAVTNKHIIMAKMRLFSRSRIEIIPLNAILNLSFDNNDSIGIVKIHLPNDAICVGMSQESIDALSKRFTQLLPVIQQYAQQLPPIEN